MRLERPRRIIRPRHYYGDTPTPTPPPPLKECTRIRHRKPLTDYIDKITGKEHNMCEACREACREAEQMRRQLREIEENIQRQEEELERAMGSHGMFNITSF